MGDEEGKYSLQHSSLFTDSLTSQVLFWEEIRVNLGDEGEKVDGNLQLVRKDPSGKVKH